MTRCSCQKNAFTEWKRRRMKNDANNKTKIGRRLKRPSVFYYVIYVFNFIINCFHVHFDLIVEPRDSFIVSYRFVDLQSCGVSGYDVCIENDLYLFTTAYKSHQFVIVCDFLAG